MKTVTLGDIFDFKNGRSFKKSEWKKKGIPIIRIQNLNDKAAIFNYFDDDYDPAIEVKQGDLLFSWSGTVGSSFGPHIWDRETAVLNQHIFKLSKKIPIENQYAFYVLKAITSEIEKQTHGAGGLVHITKEKLKKFTIPLPSLEEQKRISMRLGVMFEKIDKAIENTKKNLQNCDSLFGSLLNEIIHQSLTVRAATIGEIADIEYGLTEKAKLSGDLRFVRITDINSDGFLNHEAPMFVDTSPKAQQYLLNSGDLVVARTGATFGKVLYFENATQSVFASYLIRINFREDIHPKLFWYYAKTPQYWEQASKLSGGAAQPQFNGNALKQVVFSYPISKNEQQTMVEKLDAHHRLTIKLKKLYQCKLKDLHTLKQSLLRQAFSRSEVQ